MRKFALATLVFSLFLIPKAASAIPIGQWWMNLTSASKAAIVGGAVALPAVLTINNLRNKGRADSAGAQDAQKGPAEPRVYPAVILDGKTFLCLEPDPAGGCRLLQRAP